MWGRAPGQVLSLCCVTLAGSIGEAGLSGYLGWAGRSSWASIPGQAPGPLPRGCSFSLAGLGFLAAWWSRESEFLKGSKVEAVGSLGSGLEVT